MPRPEVEQPFRLGIADSAIDSPNWLGFAEPTPHEAPKADVEQPALDPNAGPPRSPPPPAAANPGGPGPPSPAAPMPTPARTEPASPPPTHSVSDRQPEPAAAEKPAERLIDAGGREAQEPALDEPDGRVQPEVDDPDLPLEAPGKDETPEPAQPLQQGFVGPPFEAVPSEDAVTRDSSPPAPPVVPTSNPVPPSPPPGGTGQASATVPGEQSDREADASSTEEPVDIRPGRPAAAKGLEIVTRRPDFSRVTRLTVYPPHNPRLKVRFNRDGRVSEANFVKPTGVTEIDSPVLSAVYRWTAKGEALAKLPENDPKAGVTITVTILLR